MHPHAQAMSLVKDRNLVPAMEETTNDQRWTTGIDKQSVQRDLQCHPAVNQKTTPDRGYCSASTAS